MTVLRFINAPVFALAVLGVLPIPSFAAAGNDRVVAQVTLPTAEPAGVPNGILQQGIYVTAPIILDGTTLFRVATPANASVTQMPISARVIQVQTALAQLLAEDGTGSDAATLFSPKSIRVHTRRAGDAVELEAVDAKHSDPLPIVTVTSVDARANSVNVDALASEWQNITQTSLVRALILRQPAHARRSWRRVIRLGVIFTVLTVIVLLLRRDLSMRMRRLETEIAARSAEAEAEVIAPEQPGASERRKRFLAISLHSLKPAQQLALLGATTETLLWAVVLTWFVAATWSLSLFAETTTLSQQIAHAAFAVATTAVLAALLSRALDALIARTAGVWGRRRFVGSEERARALLRVPTIARAVAGAKNFVVVFVAALAVLGQVGVPISSVLTIGGLTAITLSLAAQTFVRDFINGFLVLFEDQYIVGDYVTINKYSGIVECLTLRMVQLRDAAGDVVTIPHSAVVDVVNQSRNWSRVDYRVPVDPGADIARAIEIIRTQIAALESKDDWMHGIGDPIEWIGIDALSKDWVIIRASVRTAPLRQFELRRKINEGVLTAFAQAGIALGAQLPSL